jgi:hypothetical protein
MSLFDLISEELVIVQALELDLPSISHLCRVSRRFNEVICENELFWRQKFIRDYRLDPIYYTGSWKSLYQQYEAVWAFGMNNSGQLGLGDKKDRLTPTRIPDIKPKAIACGEGHSLLIDLEDNVWSFGSNASGQLGLGDYQGRLSPTRIPNIKAKAIACGGAILS